jgi:hypothetical protein
MDYLLLGAILLIASIGGLWFSLPVDGQMRAFARQGRDVFIAIAVTAGVRDRRQRPYCRHHLVRKLIARPNQTDLPSG